MHPPDDDDNQILDVDPDLVATARETVNALAEQAGRKSGATPIRRSFVQRPSREERQKGAPLADLVRRRDHRALLLYLMVMTLASKEPWDVRREAGLWARLLDLDPNPKGLAAVSKVIRRLKETNLVVVERKKRQASITPLHESGSGSAYSYPLPNIAADRYLKLPLIFWEEGWYQKLTLPETAMLLIFLAEKDDVHLPIDRIPEWYGISRATAQRGISGLVKKDLLASWVKQRKEPLSAIGYTFEKRYRLIGPFQKEPPKLSIPKISPPTLLGPPPPPTQSQRRRKRRQAHSTNQRKEETQ